MPLILIDRMVLFTEQALFSVWKKTDNKSKKNEAGIERHFCLKR